MRGQTHTAGAAENGDSTAQPRAHTTALRPTLVDTLGPHAGRARSRETHPLDPIASLRSDRPKVRYRGACRSKGRYAMLRLRHGVHINHASDAAAHSRTASPTRDEHYTPRKLEQW